MDGRKTAAAKQRGAARGRENIATGHLDKVRRLPRNPKKFGNEHGNVASGLLAQLRTPEHQSAAAAKAGAVNVKNGIVGKWGWSLHIRWHAKREKPNERCPHCLMKRVSPPQAATE